MSTNPTIDDRQQVIADLQAARDELVRRGRTVAHRVEPDGSVCALGAIDVAVVDNFAELYLERTLTEYGTEQWCRAIRTTPRVRAAEQELIRQLPGARTELSVAMFNDDPKTTDADVLNLFNKALAELGGLA